MLEKRPTSGEELYNAIFQWYLNLDKQPATRESLRRFPIAPRVQFGKAGRSSELLRCLGRKFSCGKVIGFADLIGKVVIPATDSGSRAMVHQEHQFTDGTLERLRAAQADLREEYLAPNKDPWIIGYSGGKDSTLLVQLVFEMLLDLAPDDRTRPVHILCNDTLVESPILMAYIDRMLGRLQIAADSLHLPIIVVKTTPDPDQTFWVNLIGRGYPAPTRMFRWCTDRMKIAPTSNYIRTKISESGEVVLLLGVRRAESANRAVTINRHRNVAGSRLNPHDDMKGGMVFRPLIDMTTDDIPLPVRRYIMDAHCGRDLPEERIPIRRQEVHMRFRR
jgi:3'-phosphoadenosine 5'-phosphosulfate sulfotransferase (PAPS reductase)/FAD synthetase